MRISDWSSDVCSSDLLQTFQFRLSDKPSRFRQPRYFTKSTKTSDKHDPHSVARPNKDANQQSGCRTLGGCALSDRATLCWPCAVVFLADYSCRGLRSTRNNDTSWLLNIIYPELMSQL